MKLDVRGTTEEIARVVLKDLGTYGSFIFYLVAAVIFYIAGAYTISLTLILSLAAVTIVVAAIRLVYFKPRPDMKIKKYNILYERIDNSSFPSIHVARGVMLSIAFFKAAPIMSPLLAILVVAVCASRIYFKRHYIVDITAGALIGLILGWVFFIAL